MPMFNQSRKIIIIGMILAVGVILILRLLGLQVFETKYSDLASRQGTIRKVVYPDRGILFDRRGKAILRNTIIYDLMVTPNKISAIDMDTSDFCRILGIDTTEFRKRIKDAIFKNRSYRPSVFEASMSDQMVARFNESIYKWEPAFYLQQRPVRDYPFDAGGNILGYLGEVSPEFLESEDGQGYLPGDYTGKAGLERTYEKVLMGQRGIEFWKRDNMNRLTDRLEDGKYDTPAISGQNLYLALDIDLQKFGEYLMQDKVGSIVAIDPQTGGILAMVSSPTYKPSLLTGSDRGRNYASLALDPRLPMYNRAINGTYPPGSTFKTLQALVGLQEGVITTSTTFVCTGAFYGCGRPMGCLDPGVFKLDGAITHSCNTYFAYVMQRAINNPRFGSVDSSLRVWNHYMRSFGLGHRLGVDLPSEKPGLLPTPELYDKIYGAGRWNFCTFRSVSIGQGEVNVTPLQIANEMAYLANKGWFITPHMVDSIGGGDKFGMLDSFKLRHKPLDIPDSIFDAVQDGMQGVMERGTGAAARIQGITVCGKTGTSENYYRGKKQRDHAVFAAFAPRENPKIAIAVICENAGFGSTTSAPIASLMIEKYLRDSIAGPARQAKAEAIANLKIMPQRILDLIRMQDSVKAARAKEALLKKVKDSIDQRQQEQRTSPFNTADAEKVPAKPQPRPQNNRKELSCILPDRSGIFIHRNLLS